MRIVHITPHLGGGVGKALSVLLRGMATTGTNDHAVLCLEDPKKRQALESIEAVGWPVTIRPSVAQVEAAVAQADIVQLEFWNHPEIPALLCALRPAPMRLLTWCHVSGLGAPCVPPELLASPARMVFTSPCSLASEVVLQSGRDFPVVSSGCVDGLPARIERDVAVGLRIGYIGTLDFAKLHPDFVEFIACLPASTLPVHLYGDLTNRDTLQAQCAALGQPGLLRFHGHVTDIARVLAGLDVLAYPLNPRHYGTAENALIEAMAMGVVPVVLDNPAERCIVAHDETGFVVNDKRGFQAAVQTLLADSGRRLAMARRAALTVRTRFTAQTMETAMSVQYRTLMRQEKGTFAFRQIFGTTPGDWFASFQPGGIPDLSQSPSTGPNKGSVHHFLSRFPEDPDLQRWAGTLEIP
ncbi:glycosyltransferase [uncultured Thiodictyon sp.]|uniref:glycosyltransferase n=1 Tax=uncultured Thiodictyon sp. TaxID=1846217 RepID=UPI0025D8056D|nr:glycosyltransferase [uncultured Thiodictyon sp.]